MRVIQEKNNNFEITSDEMEGLPPTHPIVPTQAEKLPPFNTRQVFEYDPLYTSATTDVWTGIMNEGKLAKLRDRAVYEKGSLSWYPIADSGTGVLFPSAVQAKTEVESSLRIRPTRFKGRQQLDVSYDNPDQHIDRQIHPGGWKKDAPIEWYEGKKKMPFVGFPNPNYFALYTDSIVTQNVQNLSHAQLTEAIRENENGGFESDDYLKAIGGLLRSGAIPDGTGDTPSQNVVDFSDGGGVNADPRILERIDQEYENDFNLAKRIRVAEQSHDPRFMEYTPSTAYIKENDVQLQKQEAYFNEISKFAGIASGYMNPRTVNV